MSLQYVEDFQRPDAEDDDEVLVTLWHLSGAVIAGSLNGKLRAWDASTGMYLGSARKKVHTLGINAITASADGQRLLSSALDGSLALWDASMLFAHIAHVRHSVQRESLETAEAAAPDTAGDAERDWPLSLVEAKLFQKNAKAGHSADLQVWKDADGTDGKPSISVQDASFVPFATALHPVKDVFAATGTRAEVSLHFANTDSSSKNFGRQQTRLAVAYDAGVSDAASKQRDVDFGITVAFDTKGVLVAVGTQRGHVHVYDVQSEQRVAWLKEHSSALRAVTFTPGGQLLTGCDDGHVTLYDVCTETHGERIRAGQGWTQGTTQGGATETCLNASQYSTETDASALRRRITFVRDWQAHAGWITAVQVSEDGRIAATSSLDGQIKLWDLREGRASAVWTSTQESEVWSLSWRRTVTPEPLAQLAATRELDADNKDSTTTSAVAAGYAQSASTTSMMTAAASSAHAASTFVTAGGDGVVRWYRAAGSGAAAAAA